VHLRLEESNSFNYTPPDIFFMRARGITSAPADIALNDQLGGFNFFGYRNGRYRDAGYIRATTESLGASSVRAGYVFTRLTTLIPRLSV
jgi:hypothetical protein